MNNARVTPIVWLLLAYAAALACFAVKLHYLPAGNDRWLTPLVTVCIYLWALTRSYQNNERNTVILAGICAVIADTCLAITDSADNLFLAGLGFFLLMQILYTILFARRVKRSEAFVSKKIIVSVIAYGILGSVIGAVIIASGILDNAARQSTVIFIAIVMYSLIITAMASQATTAAINVSKLKKCYGAAAVGSLIFVASDMMIALTMFGGISIPYSALLILATYWLAQTLIVGSLTKKR